MTKEACHKLISTLHAALKLSHLDLLPTTKSLEYHKQILLQTVVSNTNLQASRHVFAVCGLYSVDSTLWTVTARRHGN